MDNGELHIGIMGLGVMGAKAAQMLDHLGYKVYGWTRRHRDTPRGTSIQCYFGKDMLEEFCSKLDILVCLLPLTPETSGILNSNLFSFLPRGAAVINAARGKHLIEPELIANLDSGHLSSAILDVFEQEPLPQNSGLWNHPKIRIFPHVSSMTNIATAVEQIVLNRDSILGDGRAISPEVIVDVEAGY